MKELAASLVTIAAALAVVAAVVFGAHDTALFVPPPEAVAEQFGRQLAAGRYELARRYLSNEARRSQPAQTIEQRFEPFRRNAGALNGAEATGSPAGDERAFATCELRGATGTVAVTLALVREHGLWKVERWEPAAEIRR